MLLLILNLLLFDKSRGLKELPNNILYHEFVDYSTSSVREEHSRHRRDLSSSLSLSFQAFNRLFNLQLSKNDDVFTKNAKITTTDEGEIPYDFYSLVKGSVNGDDDSSAHGSIHEGLFEGVINYQNETYHLEPSRKYYENPDKHSVIYRFSDTVMDPSSNKCGVKDEDGNFNSIPYGTRMFGSHGHYYGGGNARTKRSSDNSTDYNVDYCTLFMGADYKFYTQHSNNFAPSIISKLGTYVQQVNEIYENTVFPGYKNRIRFLIGRAHVYTTPSNKYDESEYAVAKFLDLFSTKDDVLTPDAYCIAYMFTHRDFEDGVLGLAWVASSGYDSGGLCTKCKVYEKGFSKSRCLNTGIVTTKNVKEVPALQSYLTFGHELGHNLGSPHDPDSCSPGSTNGGNYLMYPHANTGNYANNRKLSSCSKEIMGPIIAIRGNCFEEAPEVCGDFNKDPDEDCDCGDESTCVDDFCCRGKEPGKECKFKKDSYTCSKMDGVCCNAAENVCTPYQTEAEANLVSCSAETECKSEVFCEPGSYLCPTDKKEHWEDREDMLCNGGTQVCRNGTCSESLCVFANTTSCQCTDEENKCLLCCNSKQNGVEECVPALLITDAPKLQEHLNSTTIKLPPGSVCGNDMGYCDILDVCRIVDADGPIASLGNYIFNGVLFETAQNLAVQYWYYCIMLGIGLICFMSAFIAVCSRTVKPPHIPRNGERMSYPVTANKNNMQMTGHI